jgi:PKD repeat protein
MDCMLTPSPRANDSPNGSLFADRTGPSGRTKAVGAMALLGILALAVLMAVPQVGHLSQAPPARLPSAGTSPPSSSGGTGAAELAAAEASLHRDSPATPGTGSGPQWQSLNASAVAPSARSAAALAYDPLLGAVVLFGGYFVQVAAAGDTWEFANGTWTDLTASLPVAPPARWEAGFTFDAEDGYLVLFGGRNVTAFFQDTWTFNGTAWTQLAPLVHPSARGLVGMAYDPSISAIVLVGGGVGNIPPGSYNNWRFDNDTWAFAAGAWTNLTAGLSASPPAAAGIGLAYDSGSGQLILLGGTLQPNACSLLTQEWTLSSSLTGWVNRTGTLALPYAATGYAEGGLVGDTAWGGVVLFGGVTNFSGVCQSTDQTWLFQNGSWTNLTGFFGATSPPAVTAFPMTYDASTSSVVLFGGALQGTYDYSNGTWSLSGNLTFGARIVATPARGPPPLAVNFSAAVFGATGAYQARWSFGNGNSSSSNNTTQTYSALGVYNVTLSVQDSLGTYANATATIDVAYPTNVPFNATIHPSVSQGPAPLAVNFTASISGGYAPFTMNWTFGDGNGSSATSPAHTFASDGNYTVVLIVTDAAHATASASTYVDVGGPTQVGTWTQVAPSVAPSTRSAAAMAYDPALYRVVLFGGYLGPSVATSADTWEYANGTWSNISASLALSPPARWEAGFAYDAATQSMILFGGRNLTQFFNDTWSFNASGWTQLSPASAPSPRGLEGMTYDPSIGAILLFGGGTGNVPAQTLSSWQFDSDTWEFSNGSWKNLTSALGASPPAVAGSGLVYDPQGGYDLLYGGTTAPNGCAPVSEEWTFQNGTWTNRSSAAASGPGGADGLTNFGIVYDPPGQGLLAFGGVTQTSVGTCYSTAQTWGYSNGTWTNLTGAVGTSVPANRQAFPMTYDAADGYAVLFGGNTFNSYSYLADTWTYVAGASSLLPIPTSVAVVNSEGLGPLQVTFQVLLGGGFVAIAYDWVFGDGDTASGGATITHLYGTPGVYQPSVTVASTDGRATTVQLPVVRVIAPAALPSPTGPGTSMPPEFGWPDIAGGVAGLIGGIALWVLLDRRGRRLRQEGWELAEGLQGPPPGPPEP